jgi:hypothetical protein
MSGPARAPAVPAANGRSGGATPIPTRLQRLANVADRTRRHRSDRDIRKILQVVGLVCAGLGFVAIVLGWYGAAHSPFLYQEIPYLISGGVLGLALVIAGGVLLRCAWSLRQVEEERRNAVAIVRAVDRLERVLRELEVDPALLEEEARTGRAGEQRPWN